MGDGREDRGAQVVRPLELVELRRLRLELLEVERARQLGGERVEDALLVGGDRPAGEGELVGRVHRRGRSPALGLDADRLARRPGARRARCQTVTPSSANVRRIASSTSATEAEPASLESASASARALLPSAARRAASETRPLTTTATVRNASSAIRFSVSEIVNV